MLGINRNRRERRATKIRSKIKRAGFEKGTYRLQLHKSNQHIYATVLAPVGGKVLAIANTLELRAKPVEGDKKAQARWVGEQIAVRAQEAGVTTQVACDTSGFRYHGRIKALVDAAREHGMTV